MTQTGLAEHGMRVSESLAIVSQRRRGVSACAVAIQLISGTMAGLLAVVLMDAAVGLPAVVRAGGLVVTLGLLASAVVVWRRPRRESDTAAQRRLAWELERQAGVTDNRLMNGLLLEAAGEAYDDPLTRALARRSGEHGAAVMRGLDVDRAIDREAVRRAGAWLWAVAVAWLVVTAIQPGAVGVGMKRVMLPWSTQPAFSLTRLAVMVTPERLKVGEDVQVRAAVGGLVSGEPGVLVQLDAAGSEVRAWTMRREWEADDTAEVWAYTLRQVRESMRFVVRAGGAQSRVMVVEPEAAAQESFAARDVGDAADEVVDEPTPVLADDVEGTTVRDPTAAMRRLMQQAAAIRDLADAMAAANELDEAAWRAMLEALQAELAGYADDAVALADDVQAMAGDMDDPVRSELLALAAMLRDLTLLAMADTAVGPTDVAAVRDAAEDDRSALVARGMGIDEQAEGTLSGANDELARSQRWADPAARGTYDMTMVDGAADSLRLQVMMEQAPPAYRALVERYFRVLTEEAQR